jgi:hypothetical protein
LLARFLKRPGKAVRYLVGGIAAEYGLNCSFLYTSMTLSTDNKTSLRVQNPPGGKLLWAYEWKYDQIYKHTHKTRFRKGTKTNDHNLFVKGYYQP